TGLRIGYVYRGLRAHIRFIHSFIHLVVYTSLRAGMGCIVDTDLRAEYIFDMRDWPTSRVEILTVIVACVPALYYYEITEAPMQ
ncbi:hypothetical protein KI387_011303, partial [Taxus chinensis]